MSNSNPNLKEFEKYFGTGIRTIQLVFAGTFILGGLLAFIILWLGPILGPIASAVLVGLIVVSMILLFARTIKVIKARRKKNQTALRCAYCKELSSNVETISCSSCGAIYHEDCFNLNGGCMTFACKSASKAVIESRAKTNQF